MGAGAWNAACAAAAGLVAIVGVVLMVPATPNGGGGAATAAGPSAGAGETVASLVWARRRDKAWEVEDAAV